MNGRSITLLGLLFAATLITAPLRADTIAFSVSLNTAPLGTSLFTLDFQLIDGSGTIPGDANNTVVISGINFGAGGVGSSAPISITDSSFFNDKQVVFTAGNLLKFNVLLTTNVDVGPTPDQFSFAILGVNTLDLGGSFLTVDLTTGKPTFTTFAAVSPYAQVGAPTVKITTPVPEPGSLLLLATGIFSIAASRIRWRI